MSPNQRPNENPIETLARAIKAAGLKPVNVLVPCEFMLDIVVGSVPRRMMDKEARPSVDQPYRIVFDAVKDYMDVTWEIFSQWLDAMYIRIYPEVVNHNC